MKATLALFVSVVVMVSAQNLPIVGKRFTSSYNPQTAGILADAKAITMVYVFDYWSIRATSDRNPSTLFFNVTNPDPALVNRVELKQDGGIWKAEIEIPANASLLSYYFAAGEKNDYNHNNTYVSYLYNENGTPVRNARFRNIDFLQMALKSMTDQLSEISDELKDYPDNYVAYVPYWMLRFDTASSTKSLQLLEGEVNKQFDQLEKKLGATDSLMNIKAGVLYRYALRLRADGKGLEEPIVQKFREIVKSIPPAKRFPYIRSIYRSWFGSE